MSSKSLILVVFLSFSISLVFAGCCLSNGLPRTIVEYETYYSTATFHNDLVTLCVDDGGPACFAIGFRVGIRTSVKREYIDVVSTNNYSDWPCSGCPGGGCPVASSPLQTSFSSIRLDPLTLYVDHMDGTFSSQIGCLQYAGNLDSRFIGWFCCISCVTGGGDTCNMYADISTTNFDFDYTSFLTIADGNTPSHIVNANTSQIHQVTSSGDCGRQFPVRSNWYPFTSNSSVPFRDSDALGTPDLPMASNVRLVVRAGTPIWPSFSSTPTLSTSVSTTSSLSNTLSATASTSSSSSPSLSTSATSSATTTPTQSSSTTTSASLTPTGTNTIFLTSSVTISLSTSPSASSTASGSFSSTASATPPISPSIIVSSSFSKSATPTSSSITNPALSAHSTSSSISPSIPVLSSRSFVVIATTQPKIRTPRLQKTIDDILFCADPNYPWGCNGNCVKSLSQCTSGNEDIEGVDVVVTGNEGRVVPVVGKFREKVGYVNIPNGSFPEGTVISVRPFTGTLPEDQSDECGSSDSNTEEEDRIAGVFDVSALSLDGKKVQPERPVTIQLIARFPPSKKDKLCLIFNQGHDEDNWKCEDRKGIDIKRLKGDKYLVSKEFDHFTGFTALIGDLDPCDKTFQWLTTGFLGGALALSVLIGVWYYFYSKKLWTEQNKTLSQIGTASTRG